jgi:hypothetical protein
MIRENTLTKEFPRSSTERSPPLPSTTSPTIVTAPADPLQGKRPSVAEGPRPQPRSSTDSLASGDSSLSKRGSVRLPPGWDDIDDETQGAGSGFVTVVRSPSTRQ